MRQRRLLLGAVGLALLGPVAAATVLHDPITPANCDRIQLGMTEQQVEAILGRPADCEQGGQDRWVSDMVAEPGTDPLWEKKWLGTTYVIIVHFDAQAGVCGKGCFADVEDFRELWFGRRTVWGSLRRLLPW
jgi:hypothetical protein